VIAEEARATVGDVTSGDGVQDLIQALFAPGPMVADAEQPPGDEDPDPIERPSRRRSVLIGVGIGLGAGLCAMAIAFSIIAIPMYALASFEPGQGLQRDVVRTGLLVVAMPFGALVGLAVGVTVGIWKARGGRLPQDRTPIHE
jgi:hypothetical protein